MAPRGMPGWYGGDRFRSHLEARWAIFFDELDIPWDYEPQGFVTSGSAYLPDFIVFDAIGRLWVEIKPNWKDDPEGIAKWRKFADQRPKPSRTVLLVGKPRVNATYLVIGGDEDAEDPSSGPWEDDAFEWRPCPSGHHFGLAYPGKYRTKFAEDGCGDDFGRGGEERIERAVQAALSYRFGKGGSSGTAA